jgi:hypothetical protein
MPSRRRSVFFWHVSPRHFPTCRVSNLVSRTTVSVAGVTCSSVVLIFVALSMSDRPVMAEAAFVAIDS